MELNEFFLSICHSVSKQIGAAAVVEGAEGERLLGRRRFLEEWNWCLVFAQLVMCGFYEFLL